MVPYFRNSLFGSSSAVQTLKNASVELKNVSKAAVNPVARAGKGVEEEVEELFEEYLPSSKPSALISTPSQGPQKPPKKRTSKRKPTPPQEDHDDEGDPSPSLILRVATTLLSLTKTGLRFLSVPVLYIYHFSLSLLSRFYAYLRLVLSHTLRPVLVAFAPFTYLLSGLVYIFIRVPFQLLSGVVNELWPLYIFLGAATVVGLGMGLGAAGVLYLSAFVFVDRVKKDDGLKVERIRDKGKGRRMQEEESDDVFGGRGRYDEREEEGEYLSPQSYSAGGGYFASRGGGYDSPLISPTSPYRRRSEHKGYGPAYSPSAARAY